METDPCESVVEHQPRGGSLFGEVLGVDAVSLEFVEIYSVLLQHLNRLGVVALDLEVPLEVELPRVDRTGLPSFLVEQRYAELDDFHFVDGRFYCTVLTLLLRTILEVKF